MSVTDCHPPSFHEFEHCGWEAVGDVYDECWGRLTSSFLPALLAAVSPVSERRLLDVATGPGYAAHLAWQQGAWVTGLDFSDKMVERARGHASDIRFEIGDVHDLVFADASFDIVIVNFGVQHFADLHLAFAEMSRVLRPDGKIAFTIWTDRSSNLGADVLARALETHGATASRVPAGPSYDELCDDAARRHLLSVHGFATDSIASHQVTVGWQVVCADYLYWAEYTGSVRSGARLREQTEAASERIRAAMAADVDARFRRADDTIVIPMSAYVISASKANAVTMSPRPDTVA